MAGAVAGAAGGASIRATASYGTRSVRQRKVCGAKWWLVREGKLGPPARVRLGVG